MSGMITRSLLRAFSSKALKVVNDVAKQQFSVSMPKAPEPAVIGYETAGKKITWIHTNVPEQFQGKGVGKLLAQFAFDHAEQNKLDVTCKCHFLEDYYKKNKDKYAGLKITFDYDEEAVA